MTLNELVKSSIDDENNANDTYDKMIELTKSNDSLSESDKALIMGIIFKIKTDEETHNILLKIIDDVLSDI